MKPIRDYYPIWQKLRDSEDHKCVIEAPVTLHKRVIKAVIKEKWMDEEYKNRLDKNGLAGRIEYEKIGIKIVFKMIVKKIAFSVDDF